MIDVWWQAFALTLAVELGVALLLLGPIAPRWRRVAAITAAQLASHPIVWFVLPALQLERWAYLIAAESWAVALEMLVYRVAFSNLTLGRALAIAAIANGASLCIGSLLR